MRGQRIRAGQQRARLVVLAMALLAPVAGCSSDAEQPSAELPPASSSAAETTPELPSLGPEDFPVPADARTQNEAGATAYLQYFVELLNREQAIPSGEAIRRLAPRCQQCLAIAQRLDQAAAKKWQLRGGTLTITGTPGVSVISDEAKLSFIATAAAGQVIGPDGMEIEDESAASRPELPASLTLTWSQSQSSWTPSGFSVG